MIKRFWNYQVRYRIARAMIHAGLRVWPPGRGKSEVVNLLWSWRADMETQIRRTPSTGGV